MRIIAGEFRSRVLASPPDDLTRPMPDRVKESVFQLLRGHCEGAPVLDLFAGTGNIGLEALSRGASEVVFVEKRREVAETLRENIDALRARDRCRVVVGDALGPSALAACPRPAHLVFADPPYPMMEDVRQRARVMSQFARLVACLDDAGFAVLRSPWPFRDPETGGAISLAVPGARGPETHVYRHTAVHLYMKAEGPAPSEATARFEPDPDGGA